MHPCKNKGLFIQHKGIPIALHPAASDCEFAVWNSYRRLLHERYRTPFRSCAPKQPRTLTAPLSTRHLNNGAASLFAKYRAGLLA